MPDWLESLTPGERDAWDEFVEHFRRDALEKIAGSAIVMSLLPRQGFDVKYAVELGASIMLDKPIIVIVQPGTLVPEKLRAIVEEIVVVDLGTEDGQAQIRDALSRLVPTR